MYTRSNDRPAPEAAFEVSLAFDRVPEFGA
jgi:hypothetical protein